MTVALVGALVLFFASFKMFLWLTTRVVARHQHYEATRVSGGAINEPSEKLDLFH
jgi:hypothetical protein